VKRSRIYFPAHFELANASTLPPKPATKQSLLGEIVGELRALMCAGDVGWVARWFVFKPKIQIWVIFGGTAM
jgi:hypothetical protein